MSKTCPIRLVALSIMSGAVMSAMTSMPRQADKLGESIDKSDKNCNTHNCAMWDKRRKCCGLINT